MGKLIHMPRRFDVRLPQSRLNRRKLRCAAPVDIRPPTRGVLAVRQAWKLYTTAGEIDETDPDRAIVLYTRAIALDPHLSIALINRGNCWFRKHEPDKAKADYESALRLNPAQPEANYNIGYLILESGFAGDAIPYFKQAIACDPLFADAYFNLAMALEKVGLSAQAHWRRYVELEPKGTWTEIARRHID